MCPAFDRHPAHPGAGDQREISGKALMLLVRAEGLSPQLHCYGALPSEGKGQKFESSRARQSSQ